MPLPPVRYFHTTLGLTTLRLGLTWVVLLALLLSAGCRAGQTRPHASAPPPSDTELFTLFRAAGDPDRAAALAPGVLSADALDPADPVWPIHTYLVGEVLLLRGDNDGARRYFRSLVAWADTDPCADGWGGSSLAAWALWRWAQLAESDPATSPGEMAQILQRSDRLLQTRLTLRLFRYEGLSLVPHLQEDVLRLLALLAARLEEGTESRRRLVAYLEVARHSVLEPRIQELVERLVAGDEADRDRLDLMRGRRFFDLREFETATRFLEAAQGSEDLQLASEATFYLAQVLSRRGAWKNRARVVALLEEALEDSQDPDLLQRARYAVAVARNRFGSGRDPAGFRRDLEQLIAEYPNGFRTDDALYQLAMDQYWRGETDTALATFGRLRAFQSDNDWVETAHFRPALIYYSQGDPASLGQAAALLERLANRFPDGDLASAGRFWAGRISAELGRLDRARDHFRRLVAEDPLGYYGLRARLHLRYGIEARRRRHLDAELRAEIEARRRSSSPDPLRFLSPYHRRLERTLASGFYATVFQASDHLRRSFPSLRLEQIDLRKLDAVHLVPQAGVLLALRQVAQAAKDRVPDHRNRLEVAHAVGADSGDWELAMTMVFAVGETREAAKRVAIMREPDYLAVAYPVRFREVILEHSRDQGIPPHLAYAVTRWESYLYHAALSSVGALGLFQIMPATFDNLDRDWRLLETSGAATREAFLFDPDLSIALWTRWFGERLLPRHGGDPFLAVMDHQAGSVVKVWRKDWAERRIDDDLELMVESVRHGETRIFLRAVLSSWEIAEAIDVLGARQ